MATSTAIPLPSTAMHLGDASRRASSIDLTMVRMKLADAGEGKGWDQPMLDAVERDYRRFLILNLLYPEIPIVPNEPVDSMWHAHILDTDAYMSDCERAGRVSTPLSLLRHARR